MPDHRSIRGRRADLTRLEDPGGLRRLRLEGPGILSLAGIEKLENLEALFADRLRSPALGRLAKLPHLRELVLQLPDGDVDWQALGGLSRLAFLQVSVDDRAAAEDLAAVDLSSLSRLADLRLSTSVGPVPIDLSWLPCLGALNVLWLDGFVFTNDAIDAVAAARALEELAFTPADANQATRLRDRLGDRVRLVPVKPDGTAPLGVVFDDGPPPTPFGIGLDLVDRLAVESNIEAEAVLRDALVSQLPDLAGRVAFDTESSAVWVLASSREDLERVLAVLDEEAKRRSAASG